MALSINRFDVFNMYFTGIFFFLCSSLAGPFDEGNKKTEMFYMVKIVVAVTILCSLMER